MIDSIKRKYKKVLSDLYEIVSIHQDGMYMISNEMIYIRIWLIVRPNSEHSIHMNLFYYFVYQSWLTLLEIKGLCFLYRKRFTIRLKNK